MNVVNGLGSDDEGTFLEFGSAIVFPSFLDKKDLFIWVKKLKEMGVGKDLRWRRR